MDLNSNLELRKQSIQRFFFFYNNTQHLQTILFERRNIINNVVNKKYTCIILLSVLITGFTVHNSSVLYLISLQVYTVPFLVWKGSIQHAFTGFLSDIN